MNSRIISRYVATAGLCAVLTVCGRAAETNGVIADIQAGIESYIEEQVRAGGGYFTLAHGDKNLRLKLVRVHTEYLSNLGPQRHFACVDLADVSGDVYDVDFFLSGDPGEMTVTETERDDGGIDGYHCWADVTFSFVRRGAH